ncbi:MAG: DUF5711 family protein [Oscillospiraceae bacterium]|nr:DUF5711 family protein [Oscillospiraceae bacterium]
MPVTDISAELKKRRKKKKNKRFIKKLSILTFTVCAVLTAFLTRSLWYPMLDGVLTKIPTPANTAELAGGHFPISIEGGASYSLSALDNGFCVLDDSRFFSYNLDGKINFTAQHNFANPALTVSDKKALIYDLGGRGFSLMSRSREVYSLRADAPIMFARLSSNDTAVVVAKSDKHLAYIMVYDSNGINVFNYGSVRRVIDVCFSAENDGFYITTVGSKGGRIVCEVLYYRLSQVEYDAWGTPLPIWQSGDIDTLVLSVRLLGDNIIVFGDTRYLYYSKNGLLLKNYEYPLPITGYDSNEYIAALIFEDEERRSSMLVIVDGETGDAKEVSLDYLAFNVSVKDKLVYVQSPGNISAYDKTGRLASFVDLSSDYESFSRISGYIYLLGYDEINRINFN